MEAQRTYEKHILVFLWIGAILINIKSIFTDFNVDVAYALVMACRNLNGDKMFVHMFEPHQTSSFLAEIFIWMFHKVTNSYEGVAIWLQVVGVVLFAVLTYILYRVLVKRLPRKLVHLMCIFFFTVRPKGVVFPEFSNMLILFSTLMFCLLVEMSEHSDRKVYPLLLSLCLSLGVLSYPSFIIAYPVIILLFIFYYKNNRWRNTLLLTAGCAGCGILYVAYFCWSVGGINAFIGSLLKVAAGDGSHVWGEHSVWEYISTSVLGAFWIGIGFLLALLCAVYKKFRKYILLIWGEVLNISYLLLNFYRILTHNTWNSPWMVAWSTVFLLMLLLGIPGIRKCSETERNIYILGMTISTTSTIVVMLLTNLTLPSVLPYCIVAVMVSFIPISKGFTAPRFGYIMQFIELFCLLMMIQRGMIVRDYFLCIGSITDIRNIIRSGPAKGILCSYMGYYQSLLNYNDCMQLLDEGDSLLLVTEASLDTVMYLYRPVEISHYSTICTQTYDAKLLEYWNTFPDKFPTVVAVECWYGDLKVPEDSWIVEWVEENYQDYQDGTFWRFYRKSGAAEDH